MNRILVLLLLLIFSASAVAADSKPVDKTKINQIKKRVPIKNAAKQAVDKKVTAKIDKTKAPAYIQEDDEAKLIKIVDYASSKQWGNALALRDSCMNKAQCDFFLKIMKIYFDTSDLKLNQINGFFIHNPWVPTDAFASKIESSIDPSGDYNDTIQWFKLRKPTTDNNRLLYLNALIGAGKVNKDASDAKNMLREYWINSDLEVLKEEYFLKKYKQIFTLQDLLTKIDNLTWNKDYQSAQLLINILPANYQKKPLYKIDLAKSPSKLFTLGILHGDLKDDEFVTYLEVKRNLDNDHEQKALAQLLQVAPTANYEKWWKLKNIAIRNALREKHFYEAYRLTLNHNLPQGSDFAEAEWLGGWIALRFLRNYDSALVHFQTLYDSSKLANSKSKAAYWMAKTYEALDDSEHTSQWYDTAATYKGTFYGHLAIAHTNVDQVDYFAHESDQQPDTEVIHQENVKKLAYFAYILHKANVKVLAAKIIAHIPNLGLKRHDLENVALFYVNRNYHPLSVELARVSANSGKSLIKIGYPYDVRIADNKLPKSIYLGIMRQESNFDKNAVSVAGAKGLMQLMPATYSHMKSKYGSGDAKTEAEANVHIGVKYFDSLYTKFNSIPLALAAYNAGPGNVVKWLKIYGDPREFASHDDVVDWIELIPFNETRNYVKKVMENYIVYDSLVTENHDSKILISALK
ncbi:MAG: lytic transglycosylase domain-containing protein [Rickettsiales bacterium]